MMRRSKKTIVYLSICALLMACGYSFAIEGMISYWRLDEGTGSIAYDSVGNNDGAIQGAEWTTGIVNNALNFDGVENHVNLPDSTDLSPTAAITLEAWIMPADIITDQHIVSTAGPGPSPYGHDYYIRLEYKGLDFRINDVYFFISNSVTLQNEWYHVAATYDQGEGLRKIYVNGNLLGVSSYSYPINTGHDYVTIGLNARKLAFGTIFWAFNGIIDEVAIYNRALTELEIESHYEAGLNGHGYIVGDNKKAIIVAIARIKEAVAEKLEALERIDVSIEKEYSAYTALGSLSQGGDYGGLKWGDIVAARNKINFVIQQQEQTRATLEQNIQKLKDAAWLLGYEI